MVIIALALAGGAVAMSQLTTYNLQPTTELAAVASARDKNALADIERQLAVAQKSGGISPASYRSLESKLNALEKKKVDTKKARAILAKLTLGGQKGTGEEKTKSPALSDTTSKLSTIEQNINTAINSGGIDPSAYRDLQAKLDALQAKGVDTTRARSLFRKLSVGGVESRPDCASNLRPVFTRDITDLSKMRSIFTPPNLVKGDLKTHSYMGTNHARVPIYAPVDMTLDSVSYVIGGPYGMAFEASCEVKIGFGHITEPVPAIMAVMPSAPATTTLNTGKTIRESIRFKAGDLIAYTTGTSAAGNWDFGVYNLSIKNRYANNSAYAHSWKYANAVCPFDYFTPELRVSYAKLFNLESATGLEPDGESFCSGKGETVRTTAPATVNRESNSEPPLRLKGIGINLDYFDAATGRAGDVVFTKEKLQFNVPFTEFGFVIPANMSASRTDKTNPQPTFELPLGTKVRSLVDGVVVEMPTLYSGDYSIMVAPRADTNWRYETEHVVNPLVKVGDRVTAGQVIAEVSPHNKEGNSGFGLVEIGILRGGNSPEHLCPFAYLDPSIKDDIQKKLRALYTSWEDYRGNSGLYNEEAQAAVPGCLILEPIEG